MRESGRASCPGALGAERGSGQERVWSRGCWAGLEAAASSPLASGWLSLPGKLLCGTQALDGHRTDPTMTTGRDGGLRGHAVLVQASPGLGWGG